MTELVSVIVPVYNGGHYLEQCIDSILKQSYTHIEVLLIDDGSTDGSSELCDKYSRQDDRVITIHQNNLGSACARNTGISLAKGKFVTFVDCDDIILDNFVEDLYGALQQYQADIVVSNYYKYSEYDSNFYFHNLHKCDLIEVLTPEQALAYQCDIEQHIGMSFITIWGKLYKKDLFDVVKFPENFMIDDEIVTHKLFLMSETIVLVNKNNYLYRIRPNSVMTEHSHPIKKIEDTVRAFEIKLTDMVLANIPIDLMGRRFGYILYDLRNALEQHIHNGKDYAIYNVICQRITWFEKYIQKN